MTHDINTIVVGAGVVGLAIAQKLAHSGRDVLILEALGSFGSVTSSRHSEVIHAGIYYTPGSLKAQLCTHGKALLYDYCASHHINHKRCGKLIVACNEQQVAQLDGIQANAAKNGVNDLQRMDANEVSTMEPAITALSALHSPSTGIIDSHGLMLSLLGDAESGGAMLSLHSRVQSVRVTPDGFVVEVINDGIEQVLSCAEFINASGHGACGLAGRIDELPASVIPEARFAKGNYFRLQVPAPVTHLIYPVPEPGGLGVHITLDLQGQARFGPDVEWTDRLDYTVDANRCNGFYDVIRQYWPGIPEDSLEPDYAGMRPKIAFNDEVASDFVIHGRQDHGIAGLVNLFGIESPGLTSSMAIAEYVLEQLGD